MRRNRTKVLQVGFKSVLAHLSIVRKVHCLDQPMSVVHRVSIQHFEITTPQFTDWLILTGTMECSLYKSVKTNLIRQDMTTRSGWFPI